MKKLLIVLITILISGCSVYKFSSSDKRITSFSFDANQEKVIAALYSVLESSGYKIKSIDKETGLITTETKRIRANDDVYASLKSIAELPESPLSEYTEASYYLDIKIEPDKMKTKVSIKNEIEAFERGRFNKKIPIETNGGKEKEILAKLLKALK